MTTQDELLARLLARTAPPDARGCRIWQGGTRNGYGILSVDGEMRYTHRLTWTLLRGPIPPGLQVLHTCDVKPCNALEHFFLGTQLDNLEDMRRKGRAVNPPVHYHDDLAGVLHPLVTLADVDVAAIRLRYAQGAGQRELARAFGCSQSTIHRYVYRISRHGGAAYPDLTGIWMPPTQLSLLESA